MLMKLSVAPILMQIIMTHYQQNQIIHCVYTVYGCTYPSANNYNPQATIDDGSCDFSVIACSTPTGLNTYDVVHTRLHLTSLQRVLITTRSV